MHEASKILIISTSHATMGSTGDPTGVWLEEVTTPYYSFADAGTDVTIASIAGGPIPVDPRSTEGEAAEAESVVRYHDDDDLQAAIGDTESIADIDADDYDAIFLAGGHGTMWDFATSEDLADLVVDFLETDRVVAAVCHGPAGLVHAVDDDGASVLNGRRVTGFTNSEEQAVGLTEAVPFLLESRLRELGADYQSDADFASFAVRDGNLITGQNPQSAAETARLTLEALAEQQEAQDEEEADEGEVA
jgi:putative intracellular protease/amidase